jgi:hypothetical protein
MLLGAGEPLYGAQKTTLCYNKLHCAILLDNYHCTPRDFFGEQQPQASKQISLAMSSALGLVPWL